MAPKLPWWKDAVGYQVWPASFKDSNDDGWGDIPGIISKLDHIKDLGVDFIWLSPMFDSPQYDMGYDMSNYEDIYSKFGTLEDVETLITEVHARGMRLLLDLVVNHTSHEHAWFRESKQSLTNDKADWYIWRPPKYINGQRHPPNNWRSHFWGSAWEYSPERDQYYFHLFLPQQPDMNWENPATREAIYESAIRFWLAKGIDGFRVDVANLYCKDQSFPDAAIVDPSAELQPMDPKYYANGSRMHEWLREQRQQALDPFGPDIVLIGELAETSTAEILAYTSSRHRELDMVFDFEFKCSGGPDKELVPNPAPTDFGPPVLSEVKAAFAKTQGFLDDEVSDSWTTVFMENHDFPRAVSRFGDDSPALWACSAKMLALFSCTLSGTLFMYQGQEIGMTSLPVEFSIDEMRDVASIAYVRDALATRPGDEEWRKKVMRAVRDLGRDNARTPMQWSAGVNAGFSDIEPWIKPNPNFREINVASQKGVDGSVLEFWRQLVRLRKSSEWKGAFVHGKFELLDPSNERTFTFFKTDKQTGKKVLVALNFSGVKQSVGVLESVRLDGLEVLISNIDACNGKTELRPWEGKVYVLD